MTIVCRTTYAIWDIPHCPTWQGHVYVKMWLNINITKLQSSTVHIKWVLRKATGWRVTKTQLNKFITKKGVIMFLWIMCIFYALLWINLHKKNSFHFVSITNLVMSSDVSASHWRTQNLYLSVAINRKSCASPYWIEISFKPRRK